MNPTLIAVEAKVNTPKARFRGRELVRLISLTCRYRVTLALGLLATVVFACLHTVSIGAAFPVFKLLLEEEGLHDWADRTIAGGRLGIEFAIPAPDEKLRLLSVGSDSPLYAEGLRSGDRIWNTEGGDAVQLLRDLAGAEAGEGITVLTDSVPDSGERSRAVSLMPGAPDAPLRVLRWASSRIPRSVGQDKLRTLTYLMVGLVVVIFLANVFRYLGEVLIAEAVLRAMVRLRSDLYERTLHLPMSFFFSLSTSDLVGRFVQDVQEVQRGMLTLFSKFIREPLRVVLVLGLALTLDWRLTLMVGVVTPIIVVVFWRIGRSVKKSSRKLLQAYGNMIGTLTASLQNLRVVKIFCAESQERERLRMVDLNVLKQQLRLAKLQALVSPLTETVAVVAGSFMTIWLASRVLSHELSISTFAMLGVTLSVLFDPLRRLSDVYVRVQRANAGAERIFQVIDQPTETELTAGDVALKPLERAIVYDNVSFTYPGSRTPAIRNASLEICKGETVAIVGPNGCGKTTLVSMLPRLIAPDTGEIRFDGIDIQTATLGSLRRQIGVVTQEAVVFEGTPAQNIAYGQSPADQQRIRDAADRASADEFIRNIPRGYEASLAERGTSLSGGERQRLAIARAIFRDAPILIFDEATSQIDSESELKIQTALRGFARGRTTLIIAHRLSTIQFADRIIVMDSGRIVDSGTHRELFDRCDLYHNLCETQFVTGDREGPSTEGKPQTSSADQDRQAPSTGGERETSTVDRKREESSANGERERSSAAGEREESPLPSSPRRDGNRLH